MYNYLGLGGMNHEKYTKKSQKKVMEITNKKSFVSVAINRILTELSILLSPAKSAKTPILKQ